MRIILSLVAAAWLTAPGAAAAQDTIPTPGATAGAAIATSPMLDFGTTNFLDVGLRGTFYADNSDEARYQRYRDLRNGPTIDAFRYRTETERHQYNLQAMHVGYRDQHYFASYNQFGKVKASFDWNQIPLFFSQDTATLFSSPSQGVLLLPDAIQSGLQNKTITPADAVAQASQFDLRLKRSIATAKLTYSATRQLDLNVWLRNTVKSGEQPWAGTFGFGDAVELPAPIDTRITELGAAAEWADDRGSVRVGYDGSFFRNHVGTLVWDNPLRITDSPTAGPVQGRESLWPNSNLNAGTLSGLLKLPARSQATGYVSIGRWSQNDALIPFTINTALPAITLDRTTADAHARVTSTTFTFNSQPTTILWLNARFRSYDFDNQTPIFHVANTVAYDTTVSPFAEGGTSPYSISRKTFDADASVTPLPFAAFGVGYTREAVHQTFRIFDETTENTVRVSADATGVSWLTLRGVYEHGTRTGSGLDEQTLDDIGEQVSLRQFDISDRTADRFSGLVMVMPISELAFNATASAGKEDRPGGVFGLRSNDNHTVSFGMDFVPRDAVSLGFSYEFEKYTALQRSRQANSADFLNDPTHDWTTDSDDTANTFTASLDLLKLVTKTDVRAAFEFSRANSTYVYSLVPNSTLPPVVQLPPVLNEFRRATVDVRHHLNAHVAAGVVYWYEKYTVNDFALGPATLRSLAQPSFLMLGYLYRPYTANTVSARFTYLW